MAPDLRLYLNSLSEIVRATKKNPLTLNTQASLNKINKDSEKTPITTALKLATALRVEFCKDKIVSSPLQIVMCKPICYTRVLWNKAHTVVLYVDFENLYGTGN